VPWQQNLPPARQAAGRISIDGDWVEHFEFVLPGVRGDTLQLHTKGSKVSGSGSYSMEAGRSGTLTVSGSYRAPNLALTITRDNGLVGTFKAKVMDAAHLKGIRRYKQFGASEVQFVRL
jgi:hypothetical protein